MPPPIPHGIVTGEKEGDYFIPYDEAEVLCEVGYKHKGPTQFLICEEEGAWEDEFGECTGELVAFSFNYYDTTMAREDNY